MSDLTLKEVLLADCHEKEIEQIEERKKAFLEWLESTHLSVAMIEAISAKVKEMP